MRPGASPPRHIRLAQNQLLQLEAGAHSRGILPPTPSLVITFDEDEGEVEEPEEGELPSPRPLAAVLGRAVAGASTLARRPPNSDAGELQRLRLQVCKSRTHAQPPRSLEQAPGAPIWSAGVWIGCGAAPVPTSAAPNEASKVQRLRVRDCGARTATLQLADATPYHPTVWEASA